MDSGRHIAEPLKPPLVMLLTLISIAAPAQRDAPALLAPAAAFRVEASRSAADRLRLEWEIAEGYYLYRNRFRFEIPGGGPLQSTELPAGIIKEDLLFGKSEIYRRRVAVDFILDDAAASRDPLSIRVVSQGCADIGVCFPPEEHILAVSTGLPAAALTGAGFSPTLPAASARDPLAALVGLSGTPAIREPAPAFLPLEIDFASEPGASLRSLTSDAAQQVSARGPRPPSTSPLFTRVLNTTALASLLADAARRSAPVMLDFYADWCIPCRAMEARTFSDREVQESLAGAMLLRADVTESSPDAAALLARFDLQGPPAILFFARNGAELDSRRVVGYMDPAPFAAWARAAVR